MNPKKPGTPDLGTLVLEESATDSRPQIGSGQSEGDWLCAWCHHVVANEQDRLKLDGRDEFTFRNPEGERFEIMTFSVTRGCRQAGLPTLEHTWFPGHRWSYCHCADCGHQLGWYFEGPRHFAGLVKARLVRAAYLRN